MTVRLGIDTDAVREGADRAKGILGGLGKAVAGLGIGVPAAAAVAAGVGGLAAAFASAGVAAKAFQLAVGPQMQDVAEVAGLAEEAEKAAAAGAEDAAEKQKAYNDALKDLPPATQAMAKEFIGLKKDQREWSDSLSSTTMPVFTKGLQVVRRLLPLLTPFVKAAAGAFGEFVDEIDRSTKGKGLETFADSMAKVAGQNLKSFLFGLKNIAVGIGGVIKAFLPLSTTMSGGFEESTAAFAKWGQGLSDSEGFAQFIDLARQGGQTLSTLATTALKLLVALAPLIGVTATIALHLAELINALPPSVVQALAFAILGAVVAFKAFSAASTAVDAASDLMNSRLGQVARRWVTTAATSVRAGLRMAASATVNAARTAGAWVAAAARATVTWLASMLRIAAVTIRQFVMMAARAVIWAATMAAQWLIAMGPIGWIIIAVIALVALIIAYWDEIKAFTIAVWNAVWTFIKSAADKIWQFFLNWTLLGLIIKHWSAIKDATVSAWNAVVSWVRKIPGWIYNAFLNWTALGLLIKHWSAMKRATVNKATEMINWVKGIPGRVRSGLGNLGNVLTGAGRALIQGFINGIKNMIGDVRNAASSVVSAARDFFPFSPAKEGPFAGKGYTLYSGRAIAEAFGQGITDGVPGVQSALDGMASVPGLSAVNSGRRTQLAAQAPGLRIELAGPADMKRLIRRIVQTTGRGGDTDDTFGTK
ncbi:hypothetical protein [Streptomyces sp. NPDC058678]|uniref:phage tail protein n=1 Tax=Streptomyces sp. NPDC058678 TaxID=3346595 RepID=UPI00364E5D44